MKRLLTLSLALLVLAGPLARPLTASAAGKALNISYVKSPFNLQMIVMKEHKLLEKHLEPMGVTVNWPEITSGAQQAQALASGDLDVAGVMNTTSVLMANGEGNPVKIIAGVARPTDVFAVVAKKGGVTAIKDLRGKTVAGPKGTVLHQLLVTALAREGMSMNDINFIQMDIAGGFAALQSGQVDAALLAANTVIKATQEGASILTTATGQVVPILVMASTDKFINGRPEELAAVLQAHDEAWAWIEANHDDAVKLGAEVQGVSLEDAEKLFQWSHFTQRLTQADKTSMREDVTFMLENDMMRNDVDIDAMFLPFALN